MLKMMIGRGTLISLQAFMLPQCTVENMQNGCGFKLII